MTQAKPIRPVTTKEPRQVTAAISATVATGVSALPSRENACVMPCANPRFRISTQCCIARVAVGSVAPTPKPMTTRAMTRVANPVAKPVTRVAPAQINPLTNNVLRGPNRSAVMPPIIWNSR